MPSSLSPQKWRQFLEEVHLHWQLPVSDGSIENMDELISFMSKTLGLSQSRVEREIGAIMHNFEQRLSRAA